MDDPLDGIAEGISGVVARMDRHEPSDLDGNPLTKEHFLQIPDCKPAKTAFVDGGNALVVESAAFMASLNRACFTMYEGEHKIEHADSIAEFFSLTEFKHNDKTETHLFHQAGDKSWLPDEDDLSVDTPSLEQRSKVASLSRKFAEWKIATSVVTKELNDGDILVIDGPLQTGFKGEVKYASELYDKALSKNVILCGLSKTSRAMTKAGHLLLPPIQRTGLEVHGCAKWFVPVGIQGEGDDRGHSLVVRLHEDTDYVFRLEILDKQYNEETASRVVSSLAANSRDASIPGYPYGAIEADGIARVRQSQAQAAKNTIQAAIMARPEWRAYERNAQAVCMHDRLNQVI